MTNLSAAQVGLGAPGCAHGFDLANGSVRQIIVAAEPLSPAKRQKLERAWGAEVSDQFGMTEGALVVAGAGQAGWPPGDLFLGRSERNVLPPLRLPQE